MNGNQVRVQMILHRGWYLMCVQNNRARDNRTNDINRSASFNAINTKIIKFSHRRHVFELSLHHKLLNKGIFEVLTTAIMKMKQESFLKRR